MKDQVYNAIKAAGAAGITDEGVWELVRTTRGRVGILLDDLTKAGLIERRERRRYLKPERVEG